MTETLAESVTRTPDEMRLYQQERAILEATELICELMAQKGITKTELAERLARTKGYITQLLNGNANMTLRTISDLFWALDSSVHLAAGPITLSASYPKEMS